MRTTSLGLLVLIQLIVLSLAQVSYSPFFISPREENLVQVSAVTSFGTTVHCEFSYVTAKKRASQEGLSRPIAHTQSVARAVHKDASDLFEKLANICIRINTDYWKYELCFESKVVQSHGSDVNNLGVYVKVNGNNQIYENGSPCEALPDNPGRKSRVEFVCDKNLRLLSVNEESTCSYKLVVSTPLVCGHPDFKQASAFLESQQVANAQPWFMEVYEADKGNEVVCAVSAVSNSASDTSYLPSITFQSFQLALYSSDASLPYASLFPGYHVCRAKGRVDLDMREQHYQLLHLDSDTRVVVREGQNFQGNLQHVYVQTVPKK